MDIQKIKQLIELVESSGISELEVKEGEGGIRIARSDNVSTSLTPPAMNFHPFHVDSTAPQHKPADSQSKKSAQQTITAPMVGTFYRAASPNSKPFVELGQTIKKGDVICIIEAMKMLNQIESEVSGTITGVLLENGHTVEFGQDLFSIE